MTPTPTNASTADHLLQVLAVLFRWRRFVLGLTFAAMIVAAAVVWQQPDMYTSTATFIPANPTISDETNLFGEIREERSYFGSGPEIEQMFIIGKSNSILDSLIENFDLYRSYGLNPERTGAQKKLRQIMRAYYRLTRDEHDGLHVEIDDADPVKAQQMVQATLQYIGAMYWKLTQGNKQRTLALYNRALQEKEHLFNDVTDSLRAARRKYGISSIDAQASLITTALNRNTIELAENEGRLQVYRQHGGPQDSILKYEARVAGLKKARQALTDSRDPDAGTSLTLFEQGREEVRRLEVRQYTYQSQMEHLRVRQASLEAALHESMQPIYVIEQPSLPRAKSYPRRSFTVLLTGLLAFVAACGGALVFQRAGQVNWRAIVQPI